MNLSLTDKYLSSQQLVSLESAIREGSSILAEQLWDSPKALVAALAQKTTGKNILFLTGASKEENRIYHDLPTFTDREVIDFPAWETMPSEKTPPSPDVVGERYKVLDAILHSKEPVFVLSSMQAALQKLIPTEKFTSLHMHLKVGEAPGFDFLQLMLEEMGYHKSHVAADKGEYAVRGGIIDIYPVSSPDPFRIEFFGDEIESMRIYDPVGQKSIKVVQELSLTPALELELLAKQDQMQTIIDYFGKDVLIIFDDLLALEDRYTQLISLTGKPGPTFCSIEELLEQVLPLQKIFFTEQSIDELSDVKLESKGAGYYSSTAPLIGMQFEALNRSFSAKRWRHPFVPVVDYLLLGEEASGEEILPALKNVAETHIEFLSGSQAEENTLKKKIEEFGLLLPQDTQFKQGYLSTGFAISDIKLLVLPFTEISHRYKIRRQKQRSTYHTPPSEFFNLLPGETVVHMNNGVGKFLGLEKRVDHSGVENEFFHIEYADNAKLFVPLNQAHLVSKYIGADESVPALNKIGSSKWKRAKEKTERAILGYANDLLKLYAEREIKGGFQYPNDCDDMASFEEEFPFVETEDQLIAIKAIKSDMMSEKPMDRLVCGDVGYGKTEVAMRAAFKAVMAGKQVAVLVPTTVLAMQHYENFMDRMANYPVNIGVLSRFRKPKQIKETIAGVADGTVDIVIGTHRIASKDVEFKDLGLVIIDEEQRFGVRSKEHLKKIKAGVDCLTLSATPIPRTLYMSLVGARDMSVINTPPQDRLPITTVITEPSDQVLKNALLRELTRDGQAYVIHNRVETIFNFADRVRKLLPQARIAVGHGQMGSDEIDEVFHAFKSGRADILVATTIVENGIDIPNANTILIDRADRFGLADLYQLRGRVGRWNRRAYSYFLVPSRTALNEVTRKRLSALAESSGYGGGMKLAMRDLEIRGAGDILGIEQSGHIAAVGFHLYCKMLKRTVRAMQGQGPSLVSECKVELPVDARLPEEYVNATSLRMELYQRLGDCVSLEEVDLIWEEIQDRFGPPPEPAKWLYRLSRIRVLASQNHFSLIKLEKMTLTLEKKGSLRKLIMKRAATPEELEQLISSQLRTS